MKTTLITILKTPFDSEILQNIEATKIGYNVFLTSKNLLEVQGYLYGSCGYSMFDIICTKLDKLTAETLNY